MDSFCYIEQSLNINVKKFANSKKGCTFVALNHKKKQLYNEKDNFGLNGNSSFCSL